MKSENKIIILYVITALMIVNIFISAYIEYEKNALLRGESDDVCFASAGEGNCADVQLSSYGKIFGISVSVLGALAFSFMTLLIGSIAISMRKKWPIESEKDLKYTIGFAWISFVFAIVGAVYFIFLQFFIIDAICKYCMVIDTITIVSAITFFITFKREDYLKLK